MKHLILLSFSILAMAVSSVAFAAPQSGLVKVANDPGQCHAAYDARRRTCTLVGGQCALGYVPLANPPACNCVCVPAPAPPAAPAPNRAGG
jgi:hypothetical protein